MASFSSLKNPNLHDNETHLKSIEHSWIHIKSDDLQFRLFFLEFGFILYHTAENSH